MGASPVPAVTRDQVWQALLDASYWPDAGEVFDGGDLEGPAGPMVDAVMALLAEAPQPKVLFRGRLYDYEDMGGPIIRIAGDPEAHVRKADLVGNDVLVVEAPASPAPKGPG